MSEIVKTLVEMGFDQAKSELAAEKTGGQNVQQAMDWLLANPDTEPTVVQASTSSEPVEETAQDSASDPTEVAEGTEAKSLKCDECGKLFKTQLEVEFHAAKSGHSSFSESTEEKKPLTEEEKQQQKEKLERIMQQKRKEREEREKQEALEREKLRIRSGKEMIEAKRKQDEQEIKKLVEQRKREKQEEKQARQRVKDQIEQDRLARKAKFGPQETTPAAVSPQEKPVAPTSSSSISACSTAKNYTEAKLQIRLTNGSALTQTFGAKEPLSAVRLYVEMNRTDEPGPFSLMTSFPRKTFNTDDYDKPLDILGLAPSSVIIVTRS